MSIDPIKQAETDLDKKVRVASYEETPEMTGILVNAKRAAGSVRQDPCNCAIATCDVYEGALWTKVEDTVVYRVRYDREGIPTFYQFNTNFEAQYLQARYDDQGELPKGDFLLKLWRRSPSKRLDAQREQTRDRRRRIANGTHVVVPRTEPQTPNPLRVEFEAWRDGRRG